MKIRNKEALQLSLKDREDSLRAKARSLGKSGEEKPGKFSIEMILGASRNQAEPKPKPPKGSSVEILLKKFQIAPKREKAETAKSPARAGESEASGKLKGRLEKSIGAKSISRSPENGKKMDNSSTNGSEVFEGGAARKIGTGREKAVAAARALLGKGEKSLVLKAGGLRSGGPGIMKPVAEPRKAVEILRITKRPEPVSALDTAGSHRPAFNVPKNTLAFLRQLNEKKLAKSMDKAPVVPTRGQVRKAEIRSEEKNPAKYFLSLDAGPASRGRPFVSLEGERNEHFLFLSSLLQARAEARALPNEIRQAFDSWNDSQQLEFFPFRTKASFYLLGDKIGKGCFGKVFKATQLATGATVALKAIPKLSIKNRDTRKKIDKEVQVLKLLNDNHGIIKLYEVFEDDESVYLVFELLKNGDLVKYFQVNPLLSEEDLKVFFRQIVVAIQAMHEAGILHRDIKLDNILLDEHLNPKICDFGISTILEEGKKVYDTGGTPAYLAPEVILAEGNVGPKSDVWALGVLLYLLVFGFVPFKSNDMQLLYQKILSGKFKYPEGHIGSPSLRNLISEMLRVEIDSRLSIREVLSHPWFDSGVPRFERLRKEALKSASPDERMQKGICLYLEMLGFPKSYIQQSLQKNSFNHVKACFDTLGVKLLNSVHSML